MTIKLNEDELDIYVKCEKSLAGLLNDLFNDKAYDLVYDTLIDHPWVNESDMPPGSQGIDAAADRIVHNLKQKFYQDEL